jgi:hypothetical protein
LLTVHVHSQSLFKKEISKSWVHCKHLEICFIVPGVHISIRYAELYVWSLKSFGSFWNQKSSNSFKIDQIIFLFQFRVMKPNCNTCLFISYSCIMCVLQIIHLKLIDWALSYSNESGFKFIRFNRITWLI